jgi:RNA polymerase sigma factor (sigma-70 family)
MSYTNTAHTVSTILQLIASAGTIYDEIITTIIYPNVHQKPELISELAISFLQNEERVNNVIRNNYFDYYFMQACKNQVHSSTSPFHLNCRKTSCQGIDASWIDIEDDMSDLEYKELNELQNDTLNEALAGTTTTYFEAEMFRMYYQQDLTYRGIEKECGVDSSLAFSTIKKVKERLKNKIKN